MLEVTIGPLVNKAISIWKYYLPMCILKLERTPSQKAKIRSHLDVRDGDNAGDLYRHTSRSQGEV